MTRYEVSKLDAARRQLDMAIKLYMTEKDDVSIHTLAYASHSILSDVSAKKGIDGYLFGHLKGVVKPEGEKELFAKLNEAANFFKHADKDTDGILEFNTETTAFWLWDACMLYRSLTGEHTDDMKCYWTWFGMQYPEAIDDSDAAKMFKHANTMFGSKKEFMETCAEVLKENSQPTHES